jgi:hypothetical protein
MFATQLPQVCSADPRKVRSAREVVVRTREQALEKRAFEFVDRGALGRFEVLE